jgi:hypothetical protein
MSQPAARKRRKKESKELEEGDKNKNTKSSKVRGREEKEENYLGSKMMKRIMGQSRELWGSELGKPSTHWTEESGARQLKGKGGLEKGY